jgi:hypothetical protein
MKNSNINKNRMRVAIGRLSLSKTKSVIQTSLIVGTLVALLSFSGQALGQVPNDPFVILLTGIYQPVVHGPNLGLSQVNLSDGTYSKTDIYRVSGLPGNTRNAVGNFYARFDFSLRPLCAYQLPGGAMAMEFTGGGFDAPIPDGEGGVYLPGTFELTILEATGIYQSFAGGHNHMVDLLHLLADGRADEYCFCNISRP